MNELPISNLAIIDDILSLTELGYMAVKINSFMNTKTVENRLQFGPSNSRYVVIKRANQFNLSGRITVDKWSKQNVS